MKKKKKKKKEGMYNMVWLNDEEEKVWKNNLFLIYFF
jgi:hypothetical protein